MTSDKTQETTSGLLERPPPLRMTETGDAGNIINTDDTQCRFNPNSYRMVYVASKEAFLYKPNSLTRAREVSRLH